jgi:myo-inositol-1(or 4)-monophosphatase
MPQTKETIDQLRQVAERAARSAGAIAKDRLDGERTVSVKGYRDIVTDADTAAQSSVVSTIRAAFPDHGFLVEEDDPELPTGGAVIWIIDPVDGTTNYSRHLPLFCVSIAAVTVGAAGVVQPLAAAVYDPLRDELFSAGQGFGATLNGTALHVSDTATVAEAVFALDFGHSNAVRGASMDQMARLAGEVTTIRAFGSAVLALAWVAAGRLDAYLNNALLPWDLAAGWLLTTEAGGRVSLLDGRPLRLDRSSYPGLASNGRLHDALLRAIRP